MIIVDFHQVMIASIMINLGTKTINKNELDEDLVRHMILNSIRMINTKFRNDYGNLIVAYDSKKSWRKEIFPYYKANRKKAQDKSPVDWVRLFDYFGRIKPELKEVLPYKVIEIEGCEADDIIGVLARYACEQEKVIIVSGDKDFIQLHNENVKQYDSVQKKYVSNKLSGDDFLFDHIIRGDTGDGIPNVLSDDDTFVNPEKRQTPITKKKYDMLTNSFEDVSNNINRNVARNEQLIDLAFTPEEYIIKIMDEYANFPQRDKHNLYQYLIKNNCQQLLGSIQDF
jgi:5'-3' exonuclease